MTDDHQAPDAVPLELAGKWIAWDDDVLHIVGFGETMAEALGKANDAGVAEPFLDKAPPAGTGFIGRP